MLHILTNKATQAGDSLFFVSRNTSEVLLESKLFSGKGADELKKSLSVPRDQISHHEPIEHNDSNIRLKHYTCKEQMETTLRSEMTKY